MTKHSLVLSAVLLGGCLTGPAVITGGGETDGDSEGGETGDTGVVPETSSGSTAAETLATSTTTTSADETTMGQSTESGEEGTTTTGEPQGCDVSVGGSGTRRLSYAQLQNTIFTLFTSPVVFDFQAQFQETRVGLFSAGAQPQAYAMAANAIADDLDFQLESSCGQDSACGEAYIVELVPRALRRAASQAEIDGFVGLYAAAQGTVEERIEATVAALLADPRFFEISVSGESWDEDPSVIELDANAVASKLSYFLQNGPPDAQLLDAAADGSLLEPEELMAQAVRLSESQGFGWMVRDYYAALLQTDSIESSPKDPTYIPPWDEDLAEAMKVEQELFVRELFGDGPDADPTLSGLLQSSYAWVNADLAILYGDDVVSAPPTALNFERVELDPERRPGILSRSAFLSARSGQSTWDPPPRRGQVLIRALTCVDLPAPPPGIEPLDVDNMAEWHEAVDDPMCVACHTILDPFGVALDNYDGIGRWRSAGLPQDTLPLPEGDIVFEDLPDLIDGLLETDTLSSCAVRRHFEFSARRLVRDEDDCTLEELENGFAATGGNLAELFVQIVAHPSFRLARPE